MEKTWTQTAKVAVAKLLQYLLKIFQENDFDVEKTKKAVTQSLKDRVKNDFGVDIESIIDKMSAEQKEMVGDGFYGAIDHSSPFDYGEEELVAGSLDIELLPGLPKNFWTHKIEYNQKEVHKNSCTSESGNCCLSNTFGIPFSLETRKAKWDKFVELGANPDLGWYTSKSTDADRNFWNLSEVFGTIHGEVATFKISTNSPTFWKLYNKGYMFKSGYRGNTNFSKDIVADGILNEIEFGEFGRLTYGHAIAGGKHSVETKFLDMSILNSYKGRKYNQYKVEEFKKKRSKLFFASSYFYIPKAHLDMLKVEEKAEEKSTDIIAQELGLRNGKDGDKSISRREIAYMFGRLSKKLMDGSFAKDMDKILKK